MFEWFVWYDRDFNGWRWRVSPKYHEGEVVASGFVPRGVEFDHGYRTATSQAHSACAAHNTGRVGSWSSPLFAG